MKVAAYCRLIWLVAIALGASRADAAVYYVRATAVPGDGSSWDNAFRFLWYALSVAGPGDEIRVAAGTYTPAPASRASTFPINGETLRGGYPAAGGPIPIPGLYHTILSGDIGVVGDLTDNCYHVVSSMGGSLDGFIITGGNADGRGTDEAVGGGVYMGAATTLSRCTIRGNHAFGGGGIYAWGEQDGQIMTLLDSTIAGNRAEILGLGLGGGLWIGSSDGVLGSFLIDRCSFLGNTAALNGGGATSSIVGTIMNTVFSGNHAGSSGGGLHMGTPEAGAMNAIINCTFANNESDSGAGGGAKLASARVVNCVLWGNTAATAASLLDMQLDTFSTQVSYSNTEGGVLVGTGNLSADPKYINDLGPDGVAGTLDDNLRLRPSSSSRDAGFNDSADLPYDRDNHPRIQYSRPFGATLTVDMGAYEHSTDFVVLPHQFVPQVGMKLK